MIEILVILVLLSAVKFTKRYTQDDGRLLPLSDPRGRRARYILAPILIVCIATLAHEHAFDYSGRMIYVPIVIAGYYAFRWIQNSTKSDK